MNPQKYSEHTALNHSILWRNSYSFEKPNPQGRQYCHKQVNEFAKTGVSWRTRNNMIRTNFSGINLNRSKMNRSYLSMKVSKVLRNDNNQSEKTKQLKKSISSNTDILARSMKLIEGMDKLKDMNLLSNKEMQRVRYPGQLRHAHVHNDYHDRVTNPGFSRNHSGRHYMK